MMGITVLDSSNLEAIIADATGEPAEAPKPDAAPIEAAETTAEAKTGETADDADDVEDENGTTAKQRREMSAAMLKAIGKKHRQAKEAEEFAADQIRLRREAEVRADELAAKAKALEAAAKPAPEAPKEPKRSDFGTEDEYLDARIQWGIDEGIRQRDAQRQQQEHETRIRGAMDAAKTAVPDFMDVVQKAASIVDSLPDVDRAIQESAMPAELLYHLAKNRDSLDAIAKMKPYKQVLALGKIEATLTPFGKSAQAAPKDEPSARANGGETPSEKTGISPSKTRSDAPVITPITSSSGSAVDPDPREMTTRDMIRDFQKSKGVDLNYRKRH